MLDFNNIYNIDCLEGMKDIPDKSIDCIITDLPYGTIRMSWDCVYPFGQVVASVEQNPGRLWYCSSLWLRAILDETQNGGFG